MVDKPELEPPMTRYHGIIPSTGEVIDIDAPAVRGRRRQGRRRVFALVDLVALTRLELTGQEWTVLHRVMRGVNPETNEAPLSMQEIADDLEIHQASVARCFKVLRDRRIIFTLRRSVHRINAHIMFRGSTQDWETISAVEKEPLWRK